MVKTTEELIRVLKDAKTIDEYLTEQQAELINRSLAEYLNDLLKTKNITKAEVLRKAGLAKSSGYDVFSGANNKPSRDVLLTLAFGFALNIEETQAMLEYAGHAQLFVRNKRDSIIMFCLNNGSSAVVCNELLDSKEETLLSKLSK